MPCIMKKTVFECQVRAATNDSTLSTISDKAFVLLLLECSFDCWIDVYWLQKGQVTPKEVKKHYELSPMVPPSTQRMGLYMQKQAAKKNDPKGWSVDGIKWLGDPLDYVKKSHKTNKIFIKPSCWLTERKAKITSATQA
jgi:hypothetical protein